MRNFLFECAKNFTIVQLLEGIWLNRVDEGSLLPLGIIIFAEGNS